MAAKGKKKRNWLKDGLRAALVGLVCASLALLLDSWKVLERLELGCLNLLYVTREPIKVSDRVGYVNLDNESCDFVGTWPWRRHYHEALVKTLGFYGVSAAGYDVFFTEPMDLEFNTSLLNQPLDDKNGQSLIKKTIRDYDADFAEGLRESKIIYLGEYLQGPEHQNLADRTDAGINKHVATLKEKMTEQKKRDHELARNFAFPMNDSFRSLDRQVELAAPIGKLAQHAKGIGFEQIIPDQITGTVYVNPLFLEYDGMVYSSLPMQIIKDTLGLDLPKTHGQPNKTLTFYPSKEVDGHKPVPFEVPVNDKMRMLANWSGTFFGTFFHTNYKQIATYNAYLQGKAWLRSKRPAQAQWPEALQELKTLVLSENWVPMTDVDEVAKDMVLAWAANSLAGQPREQILSALQRLVPDAKHCARVADAMQLALDVQKNATPVDIQKCREQLSKAIPLQFSPTLYDKDNYKGIDDLHQREVARNVLAFTGTKKWEAVSPPYFPPMLTSLVNGKKVPISPTMLKDKILMIGLEGEGTIDLNPQPYEESCAMVALHANTINSFLTRQFLSFYSNAETWAATILLAVIVALVCQLSSNRISIPFLFLVLGGYVAYVYWQFSSNAHWVRQVAPLLAVVASYIVSTGLQLYFAYLEKQKVKGMFGKMVSPDVLKVMSEDPDMFSLSGRRQACTSTFSSMEGFTEITKGVTPGEMIGLLGEYLTPASQIITSYRGYIDKYEGHVIMSDFGVPIRDEHHMQNCLYACIEQQLDIQAFKTYVHARFGKHVNTSMGVNTGYVSAGNMGSDRKMQYTIMGDTVNTAARFRPANWIYDYLGSIIIGESTYPLVKHLVQVRTLDKLLLKGKLKPITIYEVMGWDPKEYIKLRSGVDVSETLKTCWARYCPPEKIYGYALFWTRQTERTGLAMAAQIRDFFISKMDTAAELTTLALKQQIVANHKNYLSLAESVVTVTGKPFAPIASGDWKARLSSWKTNISAQLLLMEEKKVHDRNIDTLHRGLTEVLEKVEALCERLEADPSIDARLKKSWDEIRAFVGTAFETNGEAFDIIYSSKHALYEKEALALVESIKPRMREYHEMMAIVGSKSDKDVHLTKSYELALNTHWSRDWDKAIAQFREALNHRPEDKAALSFISRLEGYKSNPPGDNWQGEFKQTKK